ncbi:MAG: hypothetical protein AB7I27_17570 [Bacteriovoracaceae bacterium]
MNKNFVIFLTSSAVCALVLGYLYLQKPEGKQVENKVSATKGKAIPVETAPAEFKNHLQDLQAKGLKVEVFKKENGKYDVQVSEPAREIAQEDLIPNEDWQEAEAKLIENFNRGQKKTELTAEEQDILNQWSKEESL